MVDTSEDSRIVARTSSSVAKRKAAKKNKSPVKPSGPDLSQTLEELQSIHDGLRTSTVSFCRERLRRLMERLKSQQEQAP